MIRPGRRDGLAARVERIERALATPPPTDQPLNRHELAELARLEADRAGRFPGSPDEWPMELIDDYLSWQSGHDGSAQRLDHLRHRALPAAERAELAALERALEFMSLPQLDAYMAEMAIGSAGDSPCRP